MADQLTKADTRALWYAVKALAMQVRLMPGMKDDWPDGVIEAERASLTAARRALRKVNAIRKAGTAGVTRPDVETESHHTPSESVTGKGGGVDHG